MADAFLCDGVRTPFGRYGGALARVRADDLAAEPLRALMARNPRVDWGAVDEVVLGCANQAGEDNRDVARMALLLAGMPENVPGVTVNRLCASGLEAVASAARRIASDEAELVVAGGVESMSRAPFVTGKAESAFGRNAETHDTTLGWRFVNPVMRALYGVDSMPETAENVAEVFDVSRADQDAFALRSQGRAARAQAAGVFAEEIAPVQTAEGSVDQDQQPRPATTAEGLAALKTPFRKPGTVTAGNSSSLNDGAAAVIVASARAAARHGLTPVARIVGAASAGTAPRLMGMGPVPATRKLLARLGLTLADFDLIELNEAFASQALAVQRELGLPDDAGHVNPNGGAIALGHPLGASGARLAITAARELKRRDGRRALATLCVGVGQGLSLALERPD